MKSGKRDSWGNPRKHIANAGRGSGTGSSVPSHPLLDVSRFLLVPFNIETVLTGSTFNRRRQKPGAIVGGLGLGGYLRPGYRKHKSARPGYIKSRGGSFNWTYQGWLQVQAGELCNRASLNGFQCGNVLTMSTLLELLSKACYREQGGINRKDDPFYSLRIPISSSLSFQ